MTKVGKLEQFMNDKLVQNVVMNEELVQNVAMGEKFMKNGVMNAKILHEYYDGFQN